MKEQRVPNFAPSSQGFHFANAWPKGPTVTLGPFDPRMVGVGDASNGLCGGMVYTVADLHAAHVPVPPDTSPFENGSPRFKAIVRRQVESLALLTVPVRFWLRMAVGGSFGGDRAKATFEREWPKARAALDRNELTPVGLVRISAKDPRKLTHNHQVIAWGYAEDGRGVTLRIYDPNWPDRDDVTVTLHLDSALRPTHLDQSTGESVLGWFVLPYARRDPAAWR